MTTTAERVPTTQPSLNFPRSDQPLLAAEHGTERPVVFAVVYLLGACALLGLAGVIGLIAVRAEVSSLAALTALVGPAIGGLASILATTRTSPATNVQKTSGPDSRADA